MDTKKRTALIKQDIIRLIRRTGKGHTAHNIGMADIFTALYFKALNHNPRQPNWKERDRVFASEQYAPVWRATLAHSGYFARKNLFQGSQRALPGNLSMAVGSALAAQIDRKKHHTYCIISDNDLYKGEFWEAMLIAGKYRPAITLIIDRSNLQADGYAETILPIEPLREKIESFNWQVIEVDGHNKEHFIEALTETRQANKPTALIAHTIAGKGVTFIENNPEWYEKAPDENEEKAALAELQKQ